MCLLLSLFLFVWIEIINKKNKKPEEIRLRSFGKSKVLGKSRAQNRVEEIDILSTDLFRSYFLEKINNQF